MSMKKVKHVLVKVGMGNEWCTSVNSQLTTRFSCNVCNLPNPALASDISTTTATLWALIFPNIYNIIIYYLIMDFALKHVLNLIFAKEEKCSQ